MEKKAPKKGVITEALDQLSHIGNNKTYRTSKDWYDLAAIQRAEQSPVVNLTYTGTTTAACYASAADILNTAHFDNK